MMPTPALYTGPQAKPLFTDAHADGRTPPLDLLFLTDRAPATNAHEPEPYTADRSRSKAFGSTTVLFGAGVGDREIMLTLVAVGASEAVGEDAAFEIAAKGPFDMGRR
jgi:hypothetical protein